MRECRVFATDVDGTLTDGGMYYSEAGEVLKRFDTRDAAGMQLLRERGAILALITSEDSLIVTARARKLGISHVYVGVRDKYSRCRQLLEELQVPWEEFAYIGDDLGDLQVLAAAGFSACPADACPDVRKAVEYVCTRSGGHGAVREFCEHILKEIEGPVESRIVDCP
jgi:YrbI family 3-deoxy-D-manno-octulosonate 8-phosphate phosphatase